MDTTERAAPQAQGNIDEAIALFEGILQTSPDDQVALEVLSLAYEQKGNLPLAHAMLVRLAQLLVSKGDATTAASVAARLQPLAENDFDALEALRGLQALLAASPPVVEQATPAAIAPAVTPPAATPPAANVGLRRRVMQREMELAWSLLEAQEITQEEYATLVEDLTSLVTANLHSPLSVQHIVVDRQLSVIDRIRHFMVKRSKAPFIALEKFEVQPGKIDHATLDYLTLLGAIPFAKMGDELLIGLLNTTDPQLRAEIKDQLNSRCHFYLISNEAFDTAVAALRPIEEGTPET